MIVHRSKLGPLISPIRGASARAPINPGSLRCSKLLS
jgi:hypothetical protein